ncbi:HAD-IIIC family phosphatase [Paenibacillus sp. FSL R5-0486]|uniref:HAD-IIIC family phosphatase n=1 Tax=unclassified Paenibacillus TaxID=185978 RepID=UPI0030D6E034
MTIAEENTRKLVITSTFESDPIVPHMEWWAERMLPFKLNVTLHKQRMLPDLLYPRSQFMNSFDYRVVFNRFEDWIRDDDHMMEPQKCEKLEYAFKETLNAIESASQKEALIVAIFPISTEAGLSNTLFSYITELNQRWRNALSGISGVHLVDFERSQKLYVIENPFDYVKDNLAQMPFSQSFDAVMGAYLIRQLHALNNQKFKVIVLDCDNTLWEGICGENQTNVGIDNPFQSLQQTMISKMEEGMLLCIASKNNESDVWNVFENHKDMLLQKKHFVSWRINWKSKAENIREIAQELNLGMDSIIFIDDSPHECLEVMNQLPEVLTLKLPKDKMQIPAFLSHVWALDKLLITNEDRKRTQMQLTNAQRKTLETKSPEDYMNELGLQLYMDVADSSMIPRLAQLTQRTNQFNSTIIRRSEKEMYGLMQDRNYVCWAIEVTDRFGSYGLTGLIITKMMQEALIIDTFLLSCRVLGRGVEVAVFSLLKKFCLERQLTKIELVLINGDKNKAIQQFIRDNDWMEHEVVHEGERVITIPVSRIPDEVSHIVCVYGQGLDDEYLENEEPAKETESKSECIESVGEWDIFINNEKELTHAEQYIPLLHSQPTELKFLPMESRRVEHVQQEGLSELEKIVENAMYNVWGENAVSWNDRLNLNSEEVWHKFAFLSEIYQKFGVVLPEEKWEEFITRGDIIDFLKLELRGMNPYYA